MRLPCSGCGLTKPRITLHRLGHRLFCRPCLIGKPQQPSHGGTPPRPPEPQEWAAFRRFSALFTWAGLAAKAGFYVLLFFWAARSATGNAALNGIVAADLVTFAGMALLEWNLRGFRVSASAALQALILAVFLARGELFRPPEATEDVGVAFLFFLLFASLKGALHYSEIVLETSGVTHSEPLSP
ncbi:MAG: hypothetical protein ACT4PV_07590 [Planctomycetaceae bacterium]